MLVGIKDFSKQFQDTKARLESKPISQFSAEEFKMSVDELISSAKEILKGGITLNIRENTLEKLSVILFIEELMVSVNKEPIDDDKIKNVQRLAKETATEIRQSLNTINRDYQRWITPPLPNAAQTYRSAHQMLLMINSLLPFYTRSLYENKGMQDFFAFFSEFPASIDKRVLEKSKEEAQNRPSQGTSVTETKMVQTLSNLGMFRSSHSQYAALRPNIDMQYIDKELGLELDFPLANAIDIEFDGPHHFIGEENTIEHVRKEKQLQENGWIRIGLSQNTIDKYSQILGKQQDINFVSRHVGKILSIGTVGLFIQKHQQLNSLKTAVREKIKELHSQLLRDNPSAFVGNGAITIKFKDSKKKRKKEAICESGPIMNKEHKQLEELFAIEKQIVDFLDHNYLNEMINSKDFIRQSLDFDEQFNMLVKKCIELDGKIVKLNSMITVKCKEIIPMREGLTKIKYKSPLYQTRKKEVDDLQRKINQLKQERDSLEKQYQNLQQECDERVERINSITADYLQLTGLDKLIANVEAEYKSVVELPAPVGKQEQEEEYRAPSIRVGAS